MDLTWIYTQIQNLLLNNEEVILPNVGVFRVESIPASFLPDGKTILPPSKKLVFENKIIPGARLPWQEEFGAKIVETLEQDGSFEVPAFGVFTKNSQGEISFTADESFDFAPDNFSLEAIQLNPEIKTPVKEKKIPKWVISVAAIAGVLIILLFLAIVFKEQLKPVIENLLYTKEELEIIQKWAAQ